MLFARSLARFAYCCLGLTWQMWKLPVLHFDKTDTCENSVVGRRSDPCAPMPTPPPRFHLMRLSRSCMIIVVDRTYHEELFKAREYYSRDESAFEQFSHPRHFPRQSKQISQYHNSSLEKFSENFCLHVHFFMECLGKIHTLPSLQLMFSPKKTPYA